MVVGIRCKGKVQGVFFRATTKTKADQLGLTGWVKNESSGDVLIKVSGGKKAINQLIEWCQKGPDYARVTEVDTWEADTEYFEDFRIEY
ncbi:MAG: acylphosphatase [Cyclobacteriaceae bacterium]